MSSLTALETYLEPLRALFDQPGINEISINRPGEAWVEASGEMRREVIPEFNFDHLRGLGLLVAQATEQKISEETPLLSATIPGNGYRIQIVFPPACEPGIVAMSIRKPTLMQLDLDKYEQMGAFENTITGKVVNEEDIHLRELLDAGKIKDFIKGIIKAKKNVIVSGGTSTGKTTFLNATIREIPVEERVITCEDAREINIDHLPNRVHLLASKGGQGRSKVDIQDLIEACLRLRPDRIMVGELRGKEAFSYLRAVNTGHPGSISTLHADSPTLAIEQLILMIMQAGLGITRDQIKQYVENVIHVIIQLKRGERGRRYVSEIYFNPGGH